VLDAALILMDSVGSDNATGAGNQQERLSITTIGGKRRYTMERILRDYTPNPSR